MQLAINYAVSLIASYTNASILPAISLEKRPKIKPEISTDSRNVGLAAPRILW
jgi:hypothetical protein